jgi:hypothetical protein
MNKYLHCSNCLNKVFNPELGILCGLTNNKPHFINKCSSFEGNKNALITELKNDLFEWSLKNLNPYLIKKISSFYSPKNSFNLNQSYSFKETKFFKLFIILSPIFLVGILVYNQNHLFSEYSTLTKALITLSVLFCLLIFWKGIKNYKKNHSEDFDLKINRDGIYFEDTIVKWDVEEEIYFLQESQYSKQLVIINIFSKEIKCKIPLSEFYSINGRIVSEKYLLKTAAFFKENLN